jgi:large subunit ribosomal protein L10
MFALRRQCREAGVNYRVIKNTLAKLAIAGTDYEVLSDAFEGPVGIAYSEDALAPAKVLANFIKECKHLTLRLGYLDGNVLSDTDITRLSKLPGKDELRAQLLSVFNATASKFVGVLSALPRDFLGVLTARKDAL